MKTSQIWFIKVRNSLEKKLYPAVATRIIKNRVAMGVYPEDFLEYLKLKRVPKPIKRVKVVLFDEPAILAAHRLGISVEEVKRSRRRIYNSRHYDKKQWKRSHVDNKRKII